MRGIAGADLTSRRTLIAAWVAALLVVVAYTVSRSLGRTTNGFIAYYAASRLLVSGKLGSIVYDDTWFMGYVQRLTHTNVLEIYGPNSPMMALLAVPTVVFGPDGARTLWLVGSVFVLAVVSAALLREVTRDGTPLSIAVVPLVILSPSVLADIHNGQAYLFVFAAYGVAVLALSRERDVLAGIVLGLAFALKSAGAPFLLLLLVQKRFRAVAAAGVTFLAAALIVFPLVDHGMWLHYPAYVWDFIQRPSASVTANQTTHGLFRRLCIQDDRWNPSPAMSCDGIALIAPHVLVFSAVVISLWLSIGRPIRAWLAVGLCLSLLDVPIAEDPHFAAIGVPVVLLMASWTHRKSVGSWWPWVVFAALLFVPLDYTARRFTSGWSVFLAYPRLYAVWILWGMSLLEMLGSRRAAALQ